MHLENPQANGLLYLVVDEVIPAALRVLKQFAATKDAETFARTLDEVRPHVDTVWQWVCQQCDLESVKDFSDIERLRASSSQIISLGDTFRPEKEGTVRVRCTAWNGLGEWHQRHAVLLRGRGEV